MGMIQMGGNHRLVFSLQKLPGEFHPNFMGLLWRHFAGGVGMHQMIAQNTSGFAPAAFGRLHLPVGRVQLAVDGCFQYGFSVRGNGFPGVADVFQHPAQICFLRIQHIGNAVV